MVVVPTAGAARSIKKELARQAKGVLLPSFRLPLQAMLRDDDVTASPLEQLAAWVQVLSETPRREYATLVPPAVKLNALEDLVGVAARLNTVCDALGEAGLAPGSPEMVEICPHDAQRWKDFAALRSAYLSLLAEKKSRTGAGNFFHLHVSGWEQGVVNITSGIFRNIPEYPIPEYSGIFRNIRNIWPRVWKKLHCEKLNLT